MLFFFFHVYFLCTLLSVVFCTETEHLRSDLPVLYFCVAVVVLVYFYFYFFVIFLTVAYEFIYGV